MSFTWIILAWAIAAPIISYGWAAVKTKYEVTAQVRAQERHACNLRIEDIARKTREEAARRAAEAEEAASGVSRTPEEKEALQALCARSASCREREQFK